MGDKEIQTLREIHHAVPHYGRELTRLTAREAVTGYSHSGYAKSFGEFGVPRVLPRSKGWVLERAIRGTSYRDAMGCYPLFACRKWSQLPADVEEMRGDLVSLALVTDPFGDYDEALLRQCFQDVVIPFKEHFCIDLGLRMDEFVCPHHRRYARKALESLRVETCPNPAETLTDWTELYQHLIQRHHITGIAAFSRRAFVGQLAVPGLVVFRVRHNEAPVGMALFYVRDQVAYYHLGAYNPMGYELRASFALFHCAIQHFAARGLQWLDLGAGAGLRGSGNDGLTRFKRGWATGTRTAYFCGRIFDRHWYANLVKANGIGQTQYFPAYRDGEFR